MNRENLSNKNLKSLNLTYFCHMNKIQSLKDLRSYKPVSNPIQHRDSYLTATIQKMILICSYTFKDSPLFVSPKPYLNQQHKVVYLYSDKIISNKILVQEDFELYGIKAIHNYKNIYNDLYAEQQNPPQAFSKFGTYLIDHENQINQNLLSKQQLLQQFYQNDLVLKNFLPARIHQSLLLFSLTPFFQSYNRYYEALVQGQKFMGNKDLDSQSLIKLKRQNLWRFLGICTKDLLIVFPAKRTLDSKNINQVPETDEHLMMNIVTKESRKYWENDGLEISCPIKNSKPFQTTQAIFILFKKDENNQNYIQLKLKTNFFVSGTSFLFFSQFFSSVISKYTDLYLSEDFDSSLNQNLSKIQPSFFKQQMKLDFCLKLWLRPKENLITNFIKTIDILIIVYLVFENVLMHLKEDDYIRKIMHPSMASRRNFIENQIASNLYNSAKDYLEKFSEFKRNQISVGQIL